jgi:hypothetical protein
MLAWRMHAKNIDMNGSGCTRRQMFYTTLSFVFHRRTHFRTPIMSIVVLLVTAAVASAQTDGLTGEQRDTILKLHNNLRSHIATGGQQVKFGHMLPTATDMLQMVVYTRTHTAHLCS